MSRGTKVQCPSCEEIVEVKRTGSGKLIGTVVGGGLGYMLSSGLGIAGAILGAPVAIPAALVGLGVGALLGNRAGKALLEEDPNVVCPSCWESISIDPIDTMDIRL